MLSQICRRYRNHLNARNEQSWSARNQYEDLKYNAVHRGAVSLSDFILISQRPNTYNDQLPLQRWWLPGASLR